MMRQAVAGLLALAGLWCGAVILGLNGGWLLYLAGLFIWALLCFFGYRFLCISDGRLRRQAGLLSFGLALSYALGYQLQRQGGVDGFSGVGLVLTAALGLTPAVAFGVVCLYRACTKLRGQSAHTGASPKKMFWLYFAVLFASWLPVFLAYYPGLFAYDVAVQIPQITGGEYSTHHPLLHTLFLGVFYRLGGWLHSYNLGMALHTLCQMVLQGLALAYALTYLYRRSAARGLRIFCLLFFALCPIHSLLSISMTKDTLYSAALLLCLVFLHEAWVSPEELRSKWRMLRLAGMVAIVCLLRNNGVLIFLPLCGLLLLFFRKGKEPIRRILPVLLAGMLLFGGSSVLLSKGLQAKSGPVKEGLSVPLQQMGRVYSLHGEALSPVIKEEIEEFIPGVYAYVPTFADHIKAFANVGTGNMQAFLSLWARLGTQYPGEYVDAFLLNSQGFWFVDDTSQATHYGVGLEGRQGYLLTDTKEGFGVEHISYFPALERLYEQLFSANEYSRLPVVSLIFSVGLYSWLLLFLFFAAWYEKRKDILLCTGMLLLALACLFLGPCAIVRYQYPLIVGIPIFWGLLFSTEKKAKGLRG